MLCFWALSAVLIIIAMAAVAIGMSKGLWEVIISPLFFVLTAYAIMFCYGIDILVIYEILYLIISLCMIATGIKAEQKALEVIQAGSLDEYLEL